MPSSVTNLVFAVECLMLLAGSVLLWQTWLRPSARLTPASLPAWEIGLSDFFLFLWLVVLGGLAAQFGLTAFQKFHRLTPTQYSIIGTGAFHGGMLLGMLVFRLVFTRPAARFPFVFSGAVRTGVTTFLITLPVVTAVSLVWQAVLAGFHVKAENQEAIDLLRLTDSDVLRFILLTVAIIVAPVTEELIFRAGIFRYVRTRLPRWAALLLPAVLFATLHLNLGSFVPLVALAVVFSLAYERTGLISTTMVAHALFNLNASVLVLAGVNV